MQLGAYSPEVPGDTAQAVFARARAMGFTSMQYSFVTSHGEELPLAITTADIDAIAAASRVHGIAIDAINGTFNMIDRRPAQLAENLRRFEQVARAAAALGCGIVTLCTGSRSDKSMWSYHPDTALPDAWDDMIKTTRELTPIAHRYGIKLGVETEASNVVYSTERTRRYLDDIADDALGVILDCANLFRAGMARAENVRPVIAQAFDALGDNIILAHGKDILESDGIAFTAPGRGIVDYRYYFARLKQAGYSGPLILHGIRNADYFAPSIARMQTELAAAGL